MLDESNSESVNDAQPKHLLTDRNYQRLRELQQQIFTATQLSPSMHKLINALITDESLDNLNNQLMQKLGD